MQPEIHTNPCAARRSFKSALLLLLWVMLLSSCVTQRRVMNYLAEHPLPADTIVVNEIQYVDTTLFVTLPAEVIHDSIPIIIPCPEAETFVSDTVKTELKFAKASAWVSDRQLKIRLEMIETRLEFHIDSLASVRSKTITVTKTVTEKEKFVPPFYKASLFVNIFFAVLFVMVIYISLRRKS